MALSFVLDPITTPATVAGHYAGQQDLYDLVGQANAAAYFTTDGSTTEDAAAEQRALDLSDARLDGELRMNGFATPVPATSRDFPLLTYVAARWAVVEGYNKRGLQDSDPVANKVKVFKDEAAAMLASLLRPGRLDAARVATPCPTVPTAC